MPDAQTLNATLSAYGMSNLLDSGGGFNWWKIGGMLFGGIVFSVIGWFAFWRGKKEKNWRGMAIGITLMVYPYFVGNILLFFAIGIALTAALYFWRE